VLLALAAIAAELLALAWIRRRFFGAGFPSSLISVTLAGAVIATISAARAQSDDRRRRLSPNPKKRAAYLHDRASPGIERRLTWRLRLSSWPPGRGASSREPGDRC
jgi:hypothetical protein